MEKPCCTDAPGYRSLMETNKLADAEEPQGGRRPAAAPPGAATSQGVRRFTTASSATYRDCGSTGTARAAARRDLGPRPQNDSEEMEFQIRNWGCFLWLYGDNIVEQHVHNIDIANWVMAKDGDPEKAHPVEANGMGGRVNPGNYGDIFDHHFVEFTYADGTKMFSQSRHIQGTWDQVNEFVHGTKGKRSVSNGGGPKLESGNPYDQEHVDLVKAIRKDAKLNEGWFGAGSSMTAVLGRMATYSGQVVKWDDAVAKGPSESPERIAWDAKPRHVPGEDGMYPFPMPGVYKAY